MPIFRHNKPNDVLFLMPVRLANEKPSRAKVRMLYCDAAGKVYASIIKRSIYEIALADAKKMERDHKSFAILGLEFSPGNFVPATVEIGSAEVWALEHILEHALKNGRLPDILKRYLRPIIRRGAASRETVISDHRQTKPRVRPVATPRVLNRLPYYSGDDVELSMPIYKAEYSYPLVVLKRLTPNGHASKRYQKILILDSDGDLAIITVPPRLIDGIEKRLAGQITRSNRYVCAIIAQQSEGMTVNYMPISQPQRKALDTIIRYYEATGSGKQPISATAKKVLIMARGKAPFQAQ